MAEQKSQRERRPDYRLLEAASFYLGQGYSPEKTADLMEADEGLDEAIRAKLPSGGSTIRYWIRKKWLVIPDPNEAWTAAQGDPAEARLVLSVLPAFAARYKRRLPSIGEARWIARVLQVEPSLRDHPDLACRIALTAWQLTSSGAPGMDLLTEMLAYRPWEDGGEVYATATDSWFFPAQWPAVASKMAPFIAALEARQAAQ